MAIVTLRVQLRRVEGRYPVDPMTLAAALLEAVEGLGSIEVDDLEGEEATYDLTRVTWLDDSPGPIEPDRRCAHCDRAITNQPHGRARLYCSDACRQAAHRARIHRPSH